jgi:hypothetical protein
MSRRQAAGPPSGGLPQGQIAGAGRRQLSHREKLWLRLTRRLLEGSPRDFGLPAGWLCSDQGGIYTRTREAIDGLHPSTRDQLRELVIWLEAYEAAEAAFCLAPVRRAFGKARARATDR